MGHAAIRVVGGLAFLLLLFGATSRAEAQALKCAAPFGSLTISNTTNPNITDLMIKGFNDNTCALTIGPGGGRFDNPAARTVTVVARSIKFDKAILINDTTSSSMTFQAAPRANPTPLSPDGNITVTDSDLRAHLLLKFSCTRPADCSFTATGSTLISSSDLDDVTVESNTGKIMLQDIQGDITITTTLFHGGGNVEMFSINGDIVIGPCGGTPGQSCEPFTQPPFTPRVLAECGNPPVFPCAKLGLLNAAGVKEICFPPGNDVACDGGAKEKRFEARRGLIDVEGVTMTAKEHITFLCGPKGFDGRNAKITSTVAEIKIDCTVAIGGDGGTICLQGATITAGTFIVLATDSPPSFILDGPPAATFVPAGSVSSNPARSQGPCPSPPA